MYRVGLEFSFVAFALFLVAVLSGVARCFGSWVFLGLFYLRNVTQASAVGDKKSTTSFEQVFATL